VHIAERKRIYELLKPETKHEGDRRSSRQVGGLKDESFVADTVSFLRARLTVLFPTRSPPRWRGQLPRQTSRHSLRDCPTLLMRSPFTVRR
jgi:hypothetical protein